MNALKKILGGDLRQYGMVIALVALVLFFQIVTDGKILTQANAGNIVNSYAYILVMAVGMLMVIVIGQIDLSVGSVAAVVGIVVALSIKNWGIPWWAGILLGLGIGIAAGAWHGFWLAFLGIPGFITTLAGMMIFRGLNQYIGKSVTTPVPDEIKFLGSGSLPDWGPDTGFNNTTLMLGIVAIALYAALELRKRGKQQRLGIEVPPMYVSAIRIAILAVVLGYLTYLFGYGNTALSFPVAGCILLVLVIVYHFITQRTTFGRHVYAVGGNKLAASLTGVNNRRTYFLTMTNMSFLAAVAAVLYVGRAGASGAQDGTGWELEAIASVFIGGAAVSGGIGTVIGTVIGGLVMAVLNNGLYIVGTAAAERQMIKGLVLLAAVVFDVYNKMQGKPSLTGALMRTFRRHPDDESGTSTEQMPVTKAD